MAEALVENPLNTRFFCHECNRFISPDLPEFTCPQCHGGFVEQLNGDESSEDDTNISVDSESPDPASEFTELWGRMFLGPSTSDGGDNRHVHRARHLPRQRMAMRRRVAQGGASNNSATAEAAAIDLIIQNLLGIPGMVIHQEDGPSNSRSIPFPLRMFQLHANPGDYVWGNNGLDSIITQLLNQLEGTGPPPAENEKIDSLPTVNVTQENVDGHVECAVCQEILKLDEEVNKLPCKHLYHNECIVPWLRMHDSCPICRLSLSKNPTRCKEEE